MLNNIVLMGRLTNDPELRQTQSGKDVASFTLAVERDTINQTTQKRDTDFIDCIAWGNTAIFVQKYFQKGQMAAVSGRLQMREWKDKQGSTRRTAEVICNSVYFGESKKTENSNANKSHYPAPAKTTFVDLFDDDGDLPF